MTFPNRQVPSQGFYGNGYHHQAQGRNFGEDFQELPAMYPGGSSSSSSSSSSSTSAAAPAPAVPAYSPHSYTPSPVGTSSSSSYAGSPASYSNYPSSAGGYDARANPPMPLYPPNDMSSSTPASATASHSFSPASSYGSQTSPVQCHHVGMQEWQHSNANVPILHMPRPPHAHAHAQAHAHAHAQENTFSPGGYPNFHYQEYPSIPEGMGEYAMGSSPPMPLPRLPVAHPTMLKAKRHTTYRPKKPRQGHSNRYLAVLEIIRDGEAVNIDDRTKIGLKHDMQTSRIRKTLEIVAEILYGGASEDRIDDLIVRRVKASRRIEKKGSPIEGADLKLRAEVGQVKTLIQSDSRGMRWLGDYWSFLKAPIGEKGGNANGLPRDNLHRKRSQDSASNPDREVKRLKSPTDESRRPSIEVIDSQVRTTNIPVSFYANTPSPPPNMELSDRHRSQTPPLSQEDLYVPGEHQMRRASPPLSVYRERVYS